MTRLGTVVITLAMISTQAQAQAAQKLEPLEKVIMSLKPGDTFTSVFERLRRFPHIVTEAPYLIVVDKDKAEYHALFSTETRDADKAPLFAVIFFSKGKANDYKDGRYVLPVDKKGQPFEWGTSGTKSPRMK
jgi:hypothetical protein